MHLLILAGMTHTSSGSVPLALDYKVISVAFTFLPCFLAIVISCSILNDWFSLALKMAYLCLVFNHNLPAEKMVGFYTS